MTTPNPSALVVAREGDEGRAIVATLRDHDFDVWWSRDREGAFHTLDEERVDCLVTELAAERIDGLAILRRARERNPEVCAIVVTDGTERAAETMRQGAYDVQSRPLQLDKLIEVLRRGVSHQLLAERAARMAGQLDERLGFERLAGRSRAIHCVLDQVRHIASTRATVLIQGEAGTGKGLVAQSIHHHSDRGDERFVWVNCGGLDEGTIEGELFGYEGGGTSGPARTRGRFEVADGGTLLLVDVGETPPAVQVKLLRVLQDREFERVGGSDPVQVDVRLIAATSRDLAALVEAGRFREDLYYRLGAVKIELPPLRERREDIPLLAEAFIREFDREHGRKVSGITRGALDRLIVYEWPGNVRELRNTVEGMVVFARGKRPLDLSDLPAALRDAATEAERLNVAVGMTVEEAERQLITATLRHAGHDKPRAAAMLGIGLRTLYRKIKQFGLR